MAAAARDLFNARRERFDHDHAVVPDVPQCVANARPVGVVGPDDAAVAATGVEMPQVRSRAMNRIRQALLLDVHVEGVEVDAHVRAAHLFDQLNGLRRC